MLKIISYLACIVIWVFFIEVVFRLLTKVKTNITIKFVKGIIEYTGIVVLIFVYLQHNDSTKSLGTTLFQSSALLVAVLTFSAQKVLGNIISGISISFSKPFDIGEKIQLRSTSGSIVIDGYILDIKLRHTAIKQVDGKVCLIPNSVIDELVVVNNNALENNGYPFFMVCSFDSDVELAIRIMQETIDKHYLTIQTGDFASNVICSELTDDGFKLKAVVWTKSIADNFKACSDLRIQVFQNWKEQGIEVPYKTITLTK